MMLLKDTADLKNFAAWHYMFVATLEIEETQLHGSCGLAIFILCAF